MRLLSLTSGPHEDGEEIWCVFEVCDNSGNYWQEEIYYDRMEDCLQDLDVLRAKGCVFFDEFDDYDEDTEEYEQW